MDVSLEGDQSVEKSAFLVAPERQEPDLPLRFVTFACRTARFYSPLDDKPCIHYDPDDEHDKLQHRCLDRTDGVIQAEADSR